MQSSGTFLAGALAVALAAVFVASRMGLFEAPKKNIGNSTIASGDVEQYLRAIKGWDRVNLTA